jgi:hypothetical protein
MRQHVLPFFVQRKQPYRRTNKTSDPSGEGYFKLSMASRVDPRRRASRPHGQSLFAGGLTALDLASLAHCPNVSRTRAQRRLARAAARRVDPES